MQTCLFPALRGRRGRHSCLSGRRAADRPRSRTRQGVRAANVMAPAAPRTRLLPTAVLMHAPEAKQLSSAGRYDRTNNRTRAGRWRPYRFAHWRAVELDISASRSGSTQNSPIALKSLSAGHSRGHAAWSSSSAGGRQVNPALDRTPASAPASFRDGPDDLQARESGHIQPGAPLGGHQPDQDAVAGGASQHQPWPRGVDMALRHSHLALTSDTSARRCRDVERQELAQGAGGRVAVQVGR